ncbi:MAG: fibronectin type III domain-containing protein [Methanobacteriota archaeon]
MAHRKALFATVIVAILAITMLVALAPSVSAVPRVYYIHVSDGGIPSAGAIVNLTDIRSGWRGSGTTDGNGLFQTGVPFEDPGFSVVRGDTLVITAAKGGRVGMTSVILEAQASATASVSLDLAANVPPTPVAITSVDAGEGYVDVAWSESATQDFGKYGVYVSTSAGTYGSERWSSSNLKTGSCRVDGLEPGTRYYLRVAVLDAGGAAAFSGQSAVTTEGNKPVTYALLLGAIVVAAILLLVYMFKRGKGAKQSGETKPAPRRRRRRG